MLAKEERLFVGPGPRKDSQVPGSVQALAITAGYCILAILHPQAWKPKEAAPESKGSPTRSGQAGRANMPPLQAQFLSAS